MPIPKCPRRVIEISDGFWNIRGSFKIAGFVEIGTHASLVRLRSGKYVLLDACQLSGEIQAWIAELTSDGRNLEAVVHLHPFHTVFVEAAHRLYPNAALYGTIRHHRKLPDLPWQDLRTEEGPLHELYSDDFEFDVPRGVELVPANPKLHFSSVLAFHKDSRTLHVDDTIIYARLPPIIRWLESDTTRFHPTLAKVLEPGAEAADEFRSWAEELIDRAEDIDNLCAAHTSVLLGRDNGGQSIADRLRRALKRTERALERHRSRAQSS